MGVYPYEVDYSIQFGGQPMIAWNPNGKPIGELPAIYGFNTGNGDVMKYAVAITAAGEIVSGHTCSHESFMPHDLEMLAGSTTFKHEREYQKRYPNGYRTEWIPTCNQLEHKGLQEALRLYRESQNKESNQ